MNIFKNDVTIIFVDTQIKKIIHYFGWIVGLIEGVISSLGISYTKIAPKTWQKQMHQGIPKNDNKKTMSFMACHRIFPTVDLRRTEKCKNEDDNFADSLLMAEYGRRNNY